MNLLKSLSIFCVGGMLYGIIELLWRGHTHISMFLVGGLCFYLIGLIDEKTSLPIVFQLPLSALIVTAVEFISGVIINLVLKLDVWDYSGMPLNLFGQICPTFSLMWLFLSFPAIIVEDSIRVMLFNEKPKTLMFLPPKKEALIK